jgi:hypothetical protein
MNNLVAYPTTPYSNSVINILLPTAHRLRIGASPNWMDNQFQNALSPEDDSFVKQVNSATVADAELQYNGYAQHPNGWHSFWYSFENGCDQVRSKVMGAFRSQEWLYSLLPPVQRISDDSANNNNRYTVSIQAKPLPDLLGKTVENVRLVRYNFTTPRSEDGIFRIAGFGDIGYVSPARDLNFTAAEALPKALTKKTGKETAWDAVLLMGDNVYSEGNAALSKQDTRNKSGHPDGFWSDIGKPFQPFIEDSIPVFTTLGNHDVRSVKQQAMLQYLNLPCPHYRISFGADEQGKHATAEIFVMDLTLWGDDVPKAQPLVPNIVNEAIPAISEQNAWILAELEDSMRNSPHAKRMILAHYPIFQQDKSANSAHMNQFRTTMGEIYQTLQNKKITVEGETPAPFEVWLNGHVHKFTVNHTEELTTTNNLDTPLPFKLVAPLTQVGMGCTAHFEALEPEKEGWTNNQSSAEEFWKNPELRLSSMQVPCQYIGTGFTMMEIDPKEETSKIAFVEPPMQPHKIVGNNQEEYGTYFRGKPVEVPSATDLSPEQREGHPNHYKAVYAVTV